MRRIYLFVPEWKLENVLFIRFEGVNNIADVFINRRHIGEHRGDMELLSLRSQERWNMEKKTLY